MSFPIHTLYDAVINYPDTVMDRWIPVVSGSIVPVFLIVCFIAINLILRHSGPHKDNHEKGDRRTAISVTLITLSVIVISVTGVFSYAIVEPAKADVVDARTELFSDEDISEDVFSKVEAYAYLRDLDIDRACENDPDTILCSGNALNPITVDHTTDPGKSVRLIPSVDKDGDDLVVNLKESKPEN